MSIVHYSTPVTRLAPAERQACYNILEQQFLGIVPHVFEKDMGEKEVVMLLRKDHAQGEIVGFSTLIMLRLSVPGRRIIAVFSGDTAVLPPYRGSTGLGRELARYFMTALSRASGGEVYYVLLANSWRTYRLLPLLFNEFFPHPDNPTPDAAKAVIDALGRNKYPGDYDPDSGLIRFVGETQRVHPGSSDADPPLHDPYAAFFLKSNPRYLSGDELVCLARVHPDNFTHRTHRYLKAL